MCLDLFVVSNLSSIGLQKRSTSLFLLLCAQYFRICVERNAVKKCSHCAKNLLSFFFISFFLRRGKDVLNIAALCSSWPGNR